jgi:hypothetical protein
VTVVNIAQFTLGKRALKKGCRVVVFCLGGRRPPSPSSPAATVTKEEAALMDCQTIYASMIASPIFTGGASRDNCRHCGSYHSGPCPFIKAIEYFPDGTIKRVEYR